MHVLKSLNSVQGPLYWVTFAELMTIAVILRLAAFQGYSDSDPRAYSDLASNLAHGVIQIPYYDGPPVFPIRLRVYAPKTALIKVYGLSEVTPTVYPFLFSIVGCPLAYALASCLGTTLAGLIGLSPLTIVLIDINQCIAQ